DVMAPAGAVGWVVTVLAGPAVSVAFRPAVAVPLITEPPDMITSVPADAAAELIAPAGADRVTVPAVAVADAEVRLPVWAVRVTFAPALVVPPATSVLAVKATDPAVAVTVDVFVTRFWADVHATAPPALTAAA